MEWLAHSQKKYCELCKTPFHFTRIYDPQMPAQLPMRVFLRELAHHVSRRVLLWLRCVLVAFIWAGCFPYLMRVFWRLLFWLADGQWPAEIRASETGGLVHSSWGPVSAIKTPLSHATTAVATAASTLSPTPVSITTAAPALPSASPAESSFSLAASILEPLPRLALHFFLGPLMNIKLKSLRGPDELSAGTPPPAPEPRSSWLSDIEILQNLTPYPTLNNVIIDILEGQIITLSVVVAFVLLFLIREWVVQRQPLIALEELQENHELPQAPMLEPLNDGQGGDAAHNQAAEAAAAAAGPADDIDRFERGLDNSTPWDEAHLPQQLDADLVGPTAEAGPAAAADGAEPGGDRLRDGLDTQPMNTTEVRILQDVWERSQGQPDRILQIIEDEELRQIDWVVPIMRRMLEPDDDPPVLLDNEADDGTTEGETPRPEPGSEEVPAVDADQTPQATAAVQGAQLPADAERDAAFPSQPPPLDATAGELDGSAAELPPSPIDQSFSTISSAGSSIAFRAELQATDVARNEANEGPGVGDGEDRDSAAAAAEPAADEVVERPDDAADGPQADGFAENLQQAYQDLVREVHEEDEAAKAWWERMLDYFWGDLPPILPRRRARHDRHHNHRHRHPEEERAEERDPHQPRGRDRDSDRDRDRDRDHEDDTQQEQELAAEDDRPDGELGLQFQDEDDAANAHGFDNPGVGVAAAVAADVLDAEALEDAEDMEGILELIGIHGPMMNLLQNAVFSLLLVSFSVASAIWIPYVWGKFSLVLLDSPIALLIGAPITAVSLLADLFVDTCVGSIGYVCYVAAWLLRLVLKPLGTVAPALPTRTWYADADGQDPLSTMSLALVQDSGTRMKRLARAVFAFNGADFPVFSVLAHKALQAHKARAIAAGQMCLSAAKLVSYDLPRSLLQAEARVELRSAVRAFDYAALVAECKDAFDTLVGLFRFTLTRNKFPETQHLEPLTVDASLAEWNATDRVIAIAVGYAVASVLCLVYLKLRAMLHGSDAELPESAVSDMLKQAGGILKVICIVGIEMLLFPLYCGILLDIALLPLFENITLESRISFVHQSPMTALFIHWFLGTCYMFHFALFVSMCRRLMRKGVLYFIRDPDDPTFHPVRDVLDRSMATQLRKISFSALIYGALIIVCCGGVVWSMTYWTPHVLPLRWTSHYPMLEVPIDLLFYSFIMPIATRQLRLSAWMHGMYGWWFRKSARLLRLSQFLLGKRRKDEEGRWVFHTWRDAVLHRRAVPSRPKKKDDGSAYASYVKDGRFVRTPANDQVRIPKGQDVFLEVTEDNERVDGLPDADEGVHGRTSPYFTHVYIPPHFRTRITAFLFLIWIFVAVTGVGCSIGPLLVGRLAISFFVPADIQVNDIYAFSTGVYIIGAGLYLGYKARRAFRRLRRRYRHGSNGKSRSILRHMRNSTLRFLGTLYLFAAFAFFLPMLFATIMELYVLIPVHTVIAPEREHVIYSVQDWALGVLHLRLTICFILGRSGIRPAQALRAIVRDGWLRPDVRLATRAFILPTTLICLAAIAVPLGLGWLCAGLVAWWRPSVAELARHYLYRLVSPAVLLAAVSAYAVAVLSGRFKELRTELRDDVYLIGERLHDFDERPAQEMGSSRMAFT
ncbi:hypothetical protein KEM52_005463 [Ascosphaera acerosa]|nr:hypothetical protein KEM52_005463 [Ascosphaera acerosa]